MSRVVELFYSRRVPHVAALALMSFGFAGCSADTQTRLSQNPFASQPEATGSVRTPAVERRELPQYSRPQPQYQSQALPPPIAAPQSYPTAHSGVSGGGRGLASYAPPTHQPLETTATVAPRSVAAVRAPAQGSAQAGTTIIVGTSDTLDTLSRRYNVSTAAILHANGYKGPRALSPGQQLIIPRQTAAVAAPAPALAAPASKPVAVAAAPTVHVVNRGDTLLSIARRNHVPLADLARANRLDSSATLKLGQKLNVPGAKSAAAAPAAARPVATAAGQPASAPATRTAGLAGTPPQSARL
ncbi:MAG: LysM peptidoglycan-binding domain-containing protein, partial [Bradyrhizobium sp.]|nr:LysM peptidoglycan-binding domain-containing protein [Bradyrhizobium sp.]